VWDACGATPFCMLTWAGREQVMWCVHVLFMPIAAVGLAEAANWTALACDSDISSGAP
jgi:hypothetical protein